MSKIPEGKRRQFITESSYLLDAMANSARLQILTQLSSNEVSVGILSRMVGLSQSALSQHLSKLRNAGLVATRREAQTVYYRSDSAAVLKTLNLLRELFDEK